MKIVHTADWHLGKRLENKLRLGEQEDALEELNDLCDREKADIVIVAGDVFDTAVPSADAEELFYRAAVKLARRRPVVVLSGNHDDADRLGAPHAVAKLSGIYLVGGLDNTRISTSVAEGGLGSLVFKLGERLNLATLPFPAKSRIRERELLGEEVLSAPYPEFVSALVGLSTKCFGEGVNVFASHLFMDGCLMGDEYNSDSIKLTRELLPSAHYTALGHIHKPQCVSKSKNAFYSGSLLRYHFDETDEKEFIVFDSALGEVKHVPIKSGKKLVRVTANCFTEAMEKLEAAGDVYAELIYESSTPLMLSESEKLRALPALTKLSVVNKSVAHEVLHREKQSDEELFRAFYSRKRGKEPSDETLSAFMEGLNA